MTFSFFVTDESFYGRCHPVTRLLLLLLACVPPLLLTNPVPMLAVLAVYFTAAVAAGAWRGVWRVKFFIVVFLAVAIPLWAFVHNAGDTPILRAGPFRASAGSFLFGAAMGLRLICFLVAALVFLAATRVEDLAYGLRRLGLPYRVSFALSLAFRLTPLFLESASHIATAQRLRGLDLDTGSLPARVRRYVAILVPVLFAALRRADQMALALESRGFGAQAKRTTMKEYRVSWRDALWPATMTAVVAATIYLRNTL
ncbi:MAG: energy-coupling factor transporter transmembrane protein EcfT [Deltaproteobacteria bacterium]|nr:energy-coupling factor transporter transmembrane protein EcfT [Deltaproteobacteria bacterium]